MCFFPEIIKLLFTLGFLMFLCYDSSTHFLIAQYGVVQRTDTAKAQLGMLPLEPALPICHAIHYSLPLEQISYKSCDKQAQID